MATRFFYKGDKAKAEMVRREGRKQVKALREHLSFRSLSQGRSRKILTNGISINVSVFGTLNHVYITAPTKEDKRGKKGKKAEDCWCTCCWSEGKITELVGAYPSIGDYVDSTYPEAVKSPEGNIKNYNGIRYKVSICQKKVKPSSFVCLSSDFAKYEVGDEVIVAYLGKWNEYGTMRAIPTACRGCADTCDEYTACKAVKRPEQAGDEPDGSFVIVPLTTKPIT
jgi:hypothetical protein